MKRYIKILSLTLIVVILTITVSYADYKLNDGSMVTWAGGNKITVTKSDGSSYTTVGIRQGERLVPPETVANSTTGVIETSRGTVNVSNNGYISGNLLYIPFYF